MCHGDSRAHVAGKELKGLAKGQWLEGETVASARNCKKTEKCLAATNGDFGTVSSGA